MGKVRSEKMFVMGLDGMDPRLTKNMLKWASCLTPKSSLKPERNAKI